MNSSKINSEAVIHYILSFVGGYFGIYAILSRCGIFASAQTNNLISLLHDLLGGNLSDFLFRFGALFLYLLAIILTVWVPERFSCNLKLLSVLIDGLACLILGFLPMDLNPIVGLYPIFFAMAFQWCSFKGAYGYAGSTTFSTNNLRQFVTAITHFLLKKDEESIPKIHFYGGTLLNFHLGVILSFLLWQPFSLHSIWFCFLPLSGALILLLSGQPAVLLWKKRFIHILSIASVAKH